MSLVLRTIRAPLLATALLLLAACGDNPTELAAGQSGGDSEPTVEIDQNGNGEDRTVPEEDLPVDDAPDASGQQPAPAQSEYERVEARRELLSPGPAPIEELAVDADGSTVLVRYFNAAEPCSGARVTVNETDETVEVILETGLDLNAAAMSCIAGVFGYEISVPLSAPVGTRQLLAVEATAIEQPETDPLEGAVFPTDQYLGLTEIEAMALGDVEQRVVRVSRIDGEDLQVTMDFSPTRVNIELEAGIVVAATSG